MLVGDTVKLAKWLRTVQSLIQVFFQAND